MVAAALKAAQNPAYSLRCVLTTLKSFSQSCLWTLPFFFFIAGYYSILGLMGPETFQAPALQGQSLKDALSTLLKYPIKLRIIDCVEEPALPDGTIISQHPQPGQKLKLYQPVGIIISKKPPLRSAPNFQNLDAQAIAKQARDLGIRLKMYNCQSNTYPVGRCIAQYPIAHAPMEHKTLILYISSGRSPIRLMPSLCNKPYGLVSSFLKDEGLRFEAYCKDKDGRSLPHVDTQNQEHMVTAQQPLAGSFIDFEKPPIIQLQLTEKATKPDNSSWAYKKL